MKRLGVMMRLLHHRGPDEAGSYFDSRIALGHARLSIIDLSGGKQPLHNENKSVWVVFNGEIFNYPELRAGLQKRGHVFSTVSDTEVLVHLYEEKGADFLRELNGQFALAIWDRRSQQLLLARDRVGVCPLFYTRIHHTLLFASEIKALFAEPRVSRELDAVGLSQLCTMWATCPPRTVFKGIYELAPGHLMLVKEGRITLRQYWQAGFGPSETDAGLSRGNAHEYGEKLFELLKDSVRLRLRADVPVAAYLSGGLDSSFICALVKKFFSNRLQTFSVSFTDKSFDEGPFQSRMAGFLGTEHTTARCGYADIGRLMPDVVWHAEKPLIRTAPAPLFMLARLVRQSGIKVVLTGEGADEVLAGYDLFREMKIRRFWARMPDSRLRPLLMRKLYRYIPNWPRETAAFLTGFYRRHLAQTADPCYSHLPRWDIGMRCVSLFSRRLQRELASCGPTEEFTRALPRGFNTWDDLGKAQFIEMQTLLSGNLLSSQGDRMMMGNSVEGRFPFLDHRLIEFCAGLPAHLRLKVLKEKYLLKKIAQPYLPRSVSCRIKQAYRAPEAASFLHAGKPEYVRELLSESRLRKTDYFDPGAVNALVSKCSGMDPAAISARDNMALVLVVTTLLLDKLFIRDFGVDRGAGNYSDHSIGGHRVSARGEVLARRP